LNTKIVVRYRLERMTDSLTGNPSDIGLLCELAEEVTLLQAIIVTERYDYVVLAYPGTAVNVLRKDGIVV
jgi:hypothetical protein